MRFLGNKNRMLNNIDHFLNELDIKGHVFCDLFSGSGNVADHFKDRYKIICNDLLVSSCLFSKVKISNEQAPSFSKFKKIYGIDIFKYFSDKKYEMDDNHFIYKNYSPKGNRKFFTEEIANQIDGIRIEIDELYTDKIINENEKDFLLASLLETAMGFSNTSGTYEAFLKSWDSRAMRKFIFTPLTIENKKLYSNDNLVYNEDANILIRKIKGDILYLDTPYTITDYNSAYHILETIAKYDAPQIRGITGRRTDKPQKSNYSIKNKALLAYEDLIKHANFQHIIISYSTQSLISIDELKVMLEKYAIGGIIIKFFPYREYKNIRVSAKGKNLKEVLIYFKKRGEHNDY